MSLLPELARRLAQRVPRLANEPGRSWAAVAVVLAPGPDSLLLIQRAERDGDVWSGHLAFPGGRRAPTDRDLEATARRETREEVGLDLALAPLVGQLDDLTTRSPLPHLIVRPFVFLVPAAAPPPPPHPPPLRPNHEVARAWWVPLESLCYPGVYRPIEFQRYGTMARSSGYHLEGGVLWGMTERILTPMLELLLPPA